MFTLQNLLRADNPKKERLMLMIAIGLGIVALVANYIYLQRAELIKQTVLFSVKPLLPGTVLEEHLFREVEMGLARNEKFPYVTKEAFRLLKGKKLAENLETGEPLQMRAVMGLANTIKCCPEGKTSVSIEVRNESQANAYTANAGDAINLWGVIEGQSVLIKRQGYVLAAGIPNQESREGKYQSVTLLIDKTEEACLMANLPRATKTLITGLGKGDPAGVNYPAPCPQTLPPELAQSTVSLIPKNNLKSQSKNR